MKFSVATLKFFALIFVLYGAAGVARVAGFPAPAQKIEEFVVNLVASQQDQTTVPVTIFR